MKRIFIVNKNAGKGIYKKVVSNIEKYCKEEICGKISLYSIY